MTYSTLLSCLSSVLTQAILVITLATATASYGDELDIRRVSGTALTGRSKCATILRITNVRGAKPGSTPIKTLLLVAGDVGRYSMEIDAELSPPPVWLLLRNKLAVAAINKPGISLIGDGTVKVNDNILQNYTMGQLVDCWADYLKQLSRQPPAGMKINRIVMLGSGEGAHVMIRLYGRLIADRSPLAQRVKTIYMTGFSVDGGYDIDMAYALGKEKWAQVKKLMAAPQTAATTKAVYELMAKSRSIPWLKDLKAHQNLRVFFERFHQAGSKIYFNMYQGLDDSLHDIAGNRTWEVANLKAKDEGKPHIEAFIRYYSGGAGLNTAASNDLYTSLAWDIIAK